MLTYEDIQEVIKFCAREKLVLFADEVYQDNVYAEGAQFHSCKKVLRDLGAEYSGFQLISLHSSAKGYTGEVSCACVFFLLLVCFCGHLRVVHKNDLVSILYPWVLFAGLI